jgi:glycosyltransferase involved in cell wall biosynthesis
MHKIFAHGSYIGNTGYNHHTREFFRHLSNHAQIKFRNFTIGSGWKGMNAEPHNDEYYFNDTDRKILYEQVLWNTDKTRDNHKMYQDASKEFSPDVNIVLCETNHHLFYDEYYGPKIAYNVWESTLQPEVYFNKLKEFDELWVPSKWQRDCTIAQGYNPDKIKVVPEGVDINTFFPEETSHELTSDGRFKFFLAGRWDYRKSIKEIIETFLNTFDKDEPVDLIISVDNPFSGDGMKTTEERLEHYGLKDDRVKILHFPPREDYIKILKSCDAFVSCARSEGWNLPLIEAMACGTPSIYSNCSGQLEFAEGKGIPVNIIGEKPVDASTYSHFNDSVGNYYEPDFKDLGKKMRDVVTNYSKYIQIALEESEEIRNDFNWERVAEIGIETINQFLEKYPKTPDTNKTIITYLDGPRVEIKGNEGRHYFVEFIDGEGKIRFSDTISNNMWTACGIKYYVPWTIRINGEVVDNFNIENKTVLISFESKSIGDTIAWVPYAIELMNQKNCKVILSTFHNEWFEGSDSYKNIKFIKPGQSVNCDVIYKLGWFRDKDNGWKKFNLHPNQPTVHSTLAQSHHLHHQSLSSTPITLTSTATHATANIATPMSVNLRSATKRRPNDTPPQDSFFFAHNTGHHPFLAHSRIIQKYIAKYATHLTVISLVSIFDVIIHPQTLTHMFIFVHITNLKMTISLHHLTSTVIFLFFNWHHYCILSIATCLYPRDGHRALSLY